MLSRTCLLALPLLLLPAPVLAQDDLFGESEAEIGTTESLDSHEGSTEEIGQHEEGSEQIDRHEEGSSAVGRHIEGSEQLDRHEAASESMAGRESSSEYVEGVGKPASSSEQQLEAARAQLQAARMRHARQQQQSPASAATDGSTAADSHVWSARIEMARRRIDVARAAVNVWDERYATMIQRDYPRGDARQALLDDRERARQRLAAEEAMLPRLIEEAQRAGASESLLNGGEASRP